jgi:ferredoxin
MRQPHPSYRREVMKVLVDLKLCEGNQRCMEAAPEVFEVGADDQARILNVNPPAALREKVKLAARMCPRQAITVEE